MTSELDGGIMSTAQYRFINEIDSMGGRRTLSSTNGSEEVNRTMMHLLAELDGFEDRGDVKIIFQKEINEKELEEINKKELGMFV